MWQTARMLCHAIGAASPGNVVRAIDALFRLMCANREAGLADMIVSELGDAMCWVNDRSMDVALAKLLDIAADGTMHDCDLAIAMTCSAIQQSTVLRISRIVARVMLAAETWGAFGQERLLGSMEAWLLKKPGVETAQRVIWAYSEHFLSLRDRAFSRMLVASLVHILGETSTDAMRRHLLDALEVITIRSSRPCAGASPWPEAPRRSCDRCAASSRSAAAPGRPA